MRVSGLAIYPVKGGAAAELDSRDIDALGLAGDRRYCLARPGGRVFTQRDAAALARVQAALDGERLQLRINGLLDKLEAALKQALRIAATQENLKPDADFTALANLLRCYVVGRWEQYARSGFIREPLAQWPQQWPMLYFACLSQAGIPANA